MDRICPALGRQHDVVKCGGFLHDQDLDSG